MTVPLAVDWRTIEDAIHGWFSASTELTTVWENQRAPQPAYPYASLLILPGSAPSGVMAEKATQADGSVKRRRQIDFTVACTIHAGPLGATPPELSARYLLDSALMALHTQTHSDAFRVAEIGLRGPIGEPQNLDLEVGGQWLSRSRVDLRLGTAATHTDATPGWFDKVEVSSRFENLNTTGDPAPLDMDEEILDPANP